MCTGIMSCTVRIYLTPKLQYDDEGDDGDCGYDDVDNNDKQIRKLQNHHHAIICTKKPLLFGYQIWPHSECSPRSGCSVQL